MSGSKQARQAAAGQMRGKIRFGGMAGAARGNHFDGGKRSRVKWLKPGITIYKAAVARAKHVWKKPCKHDFIADPLLIPD